MSDQVLLSESAKECPIVYSTRMGVGLNLVLQVITKLARKLYEGYDIEIMERRNRHQRELPSEVALAFGEAVAQGRGWEAAKVFQHDRWGVIGDRKDEEIGFSLQRGGEVCDERSISFLGAGEEITLSCRSYNDLASAEGAIRAAIWVFGQRPGLYSMADVFAI